MTHWSQSVRSSKHIIGLMSHILAAGLCTAQIVASRILLEVFLESFQIGQGLVFNHLDTQDLTLFVRTEGRVVDSHVGNCLHSI
jgi:hypothetical protein